jgi:predicted acetyltransferase
LEIEIRDLTDRDREAVHSLRTQAFGGARREPLDPDRPQRDPEVDVVRGAYDRDGLVAAATAYRSGQWFGGRNVPMGGVAGVTTTPHARGTGVGPRLMLDVLHLMRERGFATSTLFPSTTAFYRELGWESAGPWHRVKIPARTLAALPPASRTRTRPASFADDLAVLESCYARVAPHVAGWLDRNGPYWNFRAWEFDKDDPPPRYVYVAEQAGDAIGYVAYRHVADDPRFYGIQVDDLVAVDRDALVTLLRLVGSNRTMTDTVLWRGADLASLLLVLPEQDVVADGTWHWMTRLVDAPAAVAARGYLPHVTAQVELEIHDEHAPWNAGRWVLEVTDGKGSLTPGGTGGVGLDVGALAACFTGWATPSNLARLGRVTGDEDALAALAAAFAGPTPQLADFF